MHRLYLLNTSTDEVVLELTFTEPRQAAELVARINPAPCEVRILIELNASDVYGQINLLKLNAGGYLEIRPSTFYETSKYSTLVAIYNSKITEAINFYFNDKTAG